MILAKEEHREREQYTVAFHPTIFISNEIPEETTEFQRRFYMLQQIDKTDK